MNIQIPTVEWFKVDHKIINNNIFDFHLFEYDKNGYFSGTLIKILENKIFV